MSKLAELAEREDLTPSELKRFGKRVHTFETHRLDGEDWAAAKQRVFGEIEDFIKANGGQLYTGIHSENDWSKERLWWKGGHLVNRTGNYVVILSQ